MLGCKTKQKEPCHWVGKEGEESAITFSLCEFCHKTLSQEGRKIHKMWEFFRTFCCFCFYFKYFQQMVPSNILRPRANLLPHLGSWMTMNCGGWRGDLSEEYHWGGINNEATSLTHGNIVKTFNIRNGKWFYIYRMNIFKTLLVNFFCVWSVLVKIFLG